MENQEILTVDEVAEKFRLHRISVLRKLGTGLLKGHKNGGKWYITKQDAECAFLGKCGVKEAA